MVELFSKKRILLCAEMFLSSDYFIALVLTVVEKQDQWHPFMFF